MLFDQPIYSQKSFKIKKEKHPYHLVSISPWPLLTSLAIFAFAIALVMYFHKFEYAILALHYALLFLGLFATMWWEDVIEESTFEGNHTKKVVEGLQLGMTLFIVSEAMLFFSFFWAFFHSSVSPGPFVGGIWPPISIAPIEAWGLPFSNTLLLLYSGLTITWAHRAFIGGKFNVAVLSLAFTIAIGCLFLFIQFNEYKTATISINDSAFSSCFYMITGLHGLHVLAGTIFLTIGLVRILLRHFTKSTHFGYEAAILYWHFVDAVWILVFLFVYWWGG
jgi:cytochrome c oxidase subunit 3